MKEGEIVLALDVGTRRIGIAVSDPQGQFAFPTGVLERTSLREDLERIRDLVARHGATLVVVGDPLTLKGERGIASERMRAFTDRLRRVLDVPVAQIDERLTTVQATRSMIAAGRSRQERKKTVDAVAAALLLDTFLARRRNLS